MQVPTIRLMGADEADAVAALVLQANLDNLAAFPASIAEGYQGEIRRIAGRVPNAEIYVAELDGRVIGTVTLVNDARHDNHHWPPGGAVLRFLAVAPGHEGRRLGRLLTQTCIERARTEGATFLALHTAPVMAAARHIYEQAGFVRAPDHDFDPGAHYGDGNPGDPPWGLAYLLRFD